MKHYETTAMRPNPDKADWEKYADTTEAHERGQMAKEQLRAEGRELPAGLDPKRVHRPADTTPAHERGEQAEAQDPDFDTTEAHERPADDKDLGALTVADLKKRAKAAGVEGYSSMKKDELVKALS